MFQVNVNFLAVIVAAIANMALGFLWYSQALFANAWMAAIGKTREQLGQPGPAYALTLVGALVTAYILALFVKVAQAQTLLDGALTGLLAAVGFVATSFGVGYIFEGRPRNLYLINVGYQLVSLVVMGAILGVWR